MANSCARPPPRRQFMKIYILQYAYGTHLERSSSVRGAKERARETGGDSILCLGRLAAFYVLIFPETQLHERAKQQSTTTDTHSATPFQIYINTMDNSASQNRCGSCIRALRMLFSYCAGIFHHAPQRPPPDSAPAPTDPLRCGCASLRTPGASSELWTSLPNFLCCARRSIRRRRFARTHTDPALPLSTPAAPGGPFRLLDVPFLCSVPPQHSFYMRTTLFSTALPAQAARHSQREHQPAGLHPRAGAPAASAAQLQPAGLHPRAGAADAAAQLRPPAGQLPEVPAVQLQVQARAAVGG